MDTGLLCAVYKNTTADTVTIELTKKYMNISSTALMHIGSDTLVNTCQKGMLIDSATFSYSLSSFFNAVPAVTYVTANR